MAIFVYCRQVEPSPDNLAANSLASDIQERNVRKVKISAKVTFAIWVKETISFAVLFFTKNIYHNYELLKTFSVLLLHVVIPFVFLANSSENRERLADVRFLNVIQNNSWNLVQTLANASTFNWASLNDPIKMFFSFEIDRVAPPLFLLVSFTNLKNAWDVNWAENKNFSVKISIFYFLLYYQRAYNLNRGKNIFLCKNLDSFYSVF